MFSELERLVWRFRFNETEDEKDDVFSLRMTLLRIIKLQNDFSAALDLFEFSDRKSRSRIPAHNFQKWKETAVRDGAIILEQYLQAMNIHLVGSPWQNKIDRNTFSAARRTFMRSFPNISNLRHAIVHQSEMVASKQERDKNVITTQQTVGSVQAGLPGLELGFPPNYFQNEIFATHRGKLVGYKLSSETDKVVKETTFRIFDAFSEVERSVE